MPYCEQSSSTSGSELLVRAQAAIAAVHAAGIRINRRVLDHDPTLAFGETRPSQLKASVQRTIALINQTADPQLAAIIALSLVYRQPETIRQVNVGGVAANGTIATTSWAGPRAIPVRRQLLVGGVGGRRPRRAAVRARLALVSSRRRIDPCERFSRTRLTDVLHRRHSATRSRPGWVWERQRFR
jgi:hypothetical protein